MNKIIVIGTTGSGKSTIAKKLSDKLNVPHIQLDLLFWRPNWRQSTDEEFFLKIENAIAQPQWILDGNYGKANHLTWKEADTVIWIDFPFWLTFYQNLKRSLARAIIRKELWEGTGNRESFSRMFSKDSILIWLFKTYSSNISRYQARMLAPEYKHINFYRLRSRKEVSDFLNKTYK
jgi:adenylate kinase family enzyme